MNLKVLSAVAVIAALTMPAIAHEGAKGIVKERMELMSSLGKAMKSLNAMARGKTDHDAAAVHHTANLILRESKRRLQQDAQRGQA